jgi:hypothetical protein
MSSIIRTGNTYHGFSVDCRGVFTFTDEFGTRTYAGQCKGGYACGLGVLTWSDGVKIYAEHGPDGQYDGRNVYRWFDGDSSYYLYERGEQTDYAIVRANGTCTYNGEACAPDDPRLLALIAQVTPVEVCPAAPAPPHATQTPSDRPMDQPALLAPAGACEDRGHRGASPRRTPSLVAVRHKLATAAMQSEQCDHAVMRSLAGSTWGSHGRLGLMRPSAP